MRQGNMQGLTTTHSSPGRSTRTARFWAVADAAEKCEPELVDPDRVKLHSYTLTMTVAED